jgi:elongation factor P
MAIPATALRRGMTIIFNGQPCRVIEFHHHTPGNLRAMVQAKMRNLTTGASLEHRFRASDSVEQAQMETHKLQYLYKDATSYHFMNTESFDQYEMDDEALGDHAQWMIDGMEVVAEYYNGRPISVELPNALVFEIVETAPVMKTATKTSSYKPAKLSNGVTIGVPEFLSTGERVRVNPNTGEYLDRAKE